MTLSDICYCQSYSIYIYLLFVIASVQCRSLSKLDVVGPVDNRSSTDKLHHFVKKKKKKKKNYI